MAKEGKAGMKPVIEFLIDYNRPHGWTWKGTGVNPDMWARVLGPKGAVKIPYFGSWEGIPFDPERGYHLENMGSIWSFLNRGIPMGIARGVIPENAEYRGYVPLITDAEDKEALESMKKNIRSLNVLMSKGDPYGMLKGGERFRELFTSLDQNQSVQELIKDLAARGLYRRGKAGWGVEGGGDPVDAFLEEKNRLETWLKRGLPNYDWREPLHAGAEPLDPAGRDELFRMWAHENAGGINAARQYLGLLGALSDTARDISGRHSRQAYLGDMLAAAMKGKDLNLLFGPRVPGGAHARKDDGTVYITDRMKDPSPIQLGLNVPVSLANRRFPKHRIDLLDLNSPFWKRFDPSGKAKSSDINKEYAKRMNDLVNRSVTWKDDRDASYRSISPEDLLAMGDPYLSEALGFIHGTKGRAFSGLLGMSPAFKGAYDAYEKGLAKRKAEKEAKKRQEDREAYNAKDREEQESLLKRHYGSMENMRKRSGFGNEGKKVIVNYGEGDSTVKSARKGNKDYRDFVKRMFSGKIGEELVRKFGEEAASPAVQEIMRNSPKIKDMYVKGRAQGDWEAMRPHVQDDMMREAISEARKASGEEGGVSDMRMKNIADAILSVRGPGW